MGQSRKFANITLLGRVVLKVVATEPILKERKVHALPLPVVAREKARVAEERKAKERATDAQIPPLRP